MAGKKSTTTLTFQVTIEQAPSYTIPDMRSFIKDALAGEQKARNKDDCIKDINLSEVKIHLTNKETSYGKR